MTNAQHKRLVALSDLTERHVGRNVEVGALTGRLVGVLPVGGRVQLALVVGGARVWTDAMDAGDAVEVWR